MLLEQTSRLELPSLLAFQHIWSSCNSDLQPLNSQTQSAHLWHKISNNI